MFSSGYLFAALIWGSIGMGFAIYGKKQKALAALVGGIVLIGITYLISSPLYMSLVGVAIVAAMRFGIKGITTNRQLMKHIEPVVVSDVHSGRWRGRRVAPRNRPNRRPATVRHEAPTVPRPPRPRSRKSRCRRVRPSLPRPSKGRAGRRCPTAGTGRAGGRPHLRATGRCIARRGTSSWAWATRSPGSTGRTSSPR